MKRIRLFISIVFICLLFFSSTFGQIAFDVKTLMQEKSQLRFVKLAVINNLQNSNWATVKEIGEEYSLWLTNLNRIELGDSVKSEFDIDLRTPAMFSQGKHIIGKHISVTFNVSDCSRVSNGVDSLVTDMIIQGLQSSNVYAEMLRLVSSAIPLGNLFFQMFANKFFDEFKRKPTPMELLESNLLAAKIEIELYNIFKNVR